MTTSSHSGSVRRRITIATTLAVATVITVTGLLVHRSAREYVRTTGEASLEAVLGIGAERAALEGDRVSRRGDVILSVAEGAEADRHQWLVREPADSSVLAGTLSFPSIELSDAQVWSDAGSEVRFAELVDEDGSSWRTATLVIRPLERRLRDAQRGGPQRPGDRGGERPGDRLADRMGDRPRDWEDDWQPDRSDERRPRRMDGERGGRRSRRGEGPMPMHLTIESEFEVTVAASIEDDVQQLHALARLLWIAGILGALASAVLIRTFVGAGLKPLGTLSAKVAALDAERLDETLDLPNAPVELAPIVGALDSTRARLAAAFGRERRFTSDAAHELRTPIAGLRAMLEVATRRERSGDEYRATMEECLGVTLSMQQTIETLLALARGSSDIGAFEALDLRRAARDAFGDPSDDARGITVRHAGGGPMLVHVHPATLERVTDNLVQNALAYANAGSIIDVSLREVEDSVELMVANDANGLADGIEDLAFEPFWRADQVRSVEASGVTHVGLGLSLVRRCAEALGGTVAIEVERGTETDRFVARLRLPRSTET